MPDIDAKVANGNELNLSRTKHLDKDCTKSHIHLLE